MASERLQFAGVLLLSGLLLAASFGLGGAPADDDPDPKELVRDAVESTDNKPIEGVRTEVFQRDDQFEMVTVSVTQQPPSYSRIEVIESIETDRQSDVTVVNGSTKWQYFQDEQRAVRVESDRELSDATQVFQGQTRELLDRYQANYVGRETVDDRSAHVVELTPPDDTAITLSLDVQAGATDYEFELEEASEERWYVAQETLWIDTETAYPIKQRIEWTDQEGNVVASNIRKYHELTVGADIDEEEAFEFKPPERVDVTGATLPETQTYPTVGAATDAVEFSFPEPAVPSGYELRRATVQTLDDDQGVLLTYTQESRTITIQASERSVRSEGDRVVETDVGEVDGTLLTIDGRTSLSWRCNGLYYRVSGLPDVDALAGITDSIGCSETAAGDAPPPDSQLPVSANP